MIINNLMNYGTKDEIMGRGNELLRRNIEYLRRIRC